MSDKEKPNGEMETEKIEKTVSTDKNNVEPTKQEVFTDLESDLEKEASEELTGEKTLKTTSEQETKQSKESSPDDSQETIKEKKQDSESEKELEETSAEESEKTIKEKKQDSESEKKLEEASQDEPEETIKEKKRNSESEKELEEDFPEESEEKQREKRRKARAEKRRKGKSKGKLSSKLQIARKIALVLFAVVGAYLMVVHLDLIIQTFLKKNYQILPLFLQKYMLMPIAFEGGFFIASIVILYLLGRFIDLPLWPTLLAMIILTHTLDFGVKSVMNQTDLYYLTLKPWLLRIPGILLTVAVGRIVLRIALIREEE